MPLQKQTLNISFGQGVDTKTDPFQVEVGKFLSLQNSVFTKGKMLQKRNGFGALTSLPDSSSTYLTTFNNDLTAIGSDLLAYSAPSKTWISQADITPVGLDVLSLIRNNTNQSQADAAVAPNGFVCTAYTDQTPSSLTTPIYKYVIADSVTGQNIIEPTPISDANTTYGIPRVYLLSSYFIVVYISIVTATYHLRFIAIPVSNPTQPLVAQDLSTSLTPSDHGQSFDAVVYNNILYFAWNGSASSGLKMNTLSNGLVVSGTINPDSAHVADIVSVSADSLTGVIWVSYYDYAANVAYALAFNSQLHLLPDFTSPIEIIPSPLTHVSNLTGSAQNGVLSFFYEIINAYSYDSSIPSNFIKINTITQVGVLGTATVFLRSVGLASKSFIVEGVIYVATLYVSPYQSTYFLANGTSQIISRFDYQNAPTNYYSHGLPLVSVQGSVAQFCYLIKDLIQSVNKNTNIPAGSQVNGIYSQTGINLMSLSFGSDRLTSAELGLNLNLSGGFAQAYDGYSLSEQNFFLYPDSIKATWDATGGSIVAKPDSVTNTSAYFYQVTYEWSDNQGNLIRSAPSIPVSVTTTGNGTAGSITVDIPTLRLSLKNANNPVKIVIYRWSVGQQSYYQTTSITIPTLNNPAVDSIAFVDTHADSTILGNNLLYTTGGVLENVGAPAFDSVFIFDSRLWGIVSEDKNLLWFSKQVIESTPVEMSDLLTQFVSPTIGAQGSTGDLKCGAQMDDKLVLFKRSAMNYLSGVGPDSTGANNGYSQPIFITSTVGCSNQNSIVFQPDGLMFEFSSESGNQIWILGRNLQTQYIGAPVEQYTKSASILSAVNIPGTNQVRFTLSTGITLMYDYYYGQWGTFMNIPAISSVLYQGLHTYINSLGQVFQETPGTYLDGSSPVLMSVTSSWLNLAGLQGYQRAYFFYLLGVYLSPHLLSIGIAYDYNTAIQQQTLVTPNNFSPNYGNSFAYGMQSTYGETSSLEQWKVYLKQQRCVAFRITLTELFNPALGQSAGAGFTLSGLDVVLGLKKGYRPMKYTSQVGGASS